MVEQIAIAYLAIGLVGLVTYVFATIFVYAGEKDYELSVASTRSTTIDLKSMTPPRNIGTQTSNKDSNEGSNDVQVVGPVQVARSKAVIGFEHEGRSQRVIDESSKPKRQLLY